jgi:hypothetical protein
MRESRKHARHSPEESGSQISQRQEVLVLESEYTRWKSWEEGHPGELRKFEKRICALIRKNAQLSAQLLERLPAMTSLSETLWKTNRQFEQITQYVWQELQTLRNQFPSSDLGRERAQLEMEIADLREAIRTARQSKEEESQ